MQQFQGRATSHGLPTPFDVSVELELDPGEQPSWSGHIELPQYTSMERGEPIRLQLSDGRWGEIKLKSRVPLGGGFEFPFAGVGPLHQSEEKT